jgi:hypothetical protein
MKTRRGSSEGGLGQRRALQRCPTRREALRRQPAGLRWPREIGPGTRSRCTAAQNHVHRPRPVNADRRCRRPLPEEKPPSDWKRACDNACWIIRWRSTAGSTRLRLRRSNARNGGWGRNLEGVACGPTGEGKKEKREAEGQRNRTLERSCRSYESPDCLRTWVRRGDVAAGSPGQFVIEAGDGRDHAGAEQRDPDRPQ